MSGCVWAKHSLHALSNLIYIDEWTLSARNPVICLFSFFTIRNTSKYFQFSFVRRPCLAVGGTWYVVRVGGNRVESVHTCPHWSVARTRVQVPEHRTMTNVMAAAQTQASSFRSARQRAQENAKQHSHSIRCQSNRPIFVRVLFWGNFIYVRFNHLISFSFSFSLSQCCAVCVEYHCACVTCC